MAQGVGTGSLASAESNLYQHVSAYYWIPRWVIILILDPTTFTEALLIMGVFFCNYLLQREANRRDILYHYDTDIISSLPRLKHLAKVKII